jgi:hypothetical protein
LRFDLDRGKAGMENPYVARAGGDPVAGTVNGRLPIP